MASNPEVQPMDIQFMTSIAPIVRDTEASRIFYADTLGLDFEGHDGEYVFTHELDGTKHFGSGPFRKRPKPVSAPPNGLPRPRLPRPALSSRSLTRRPQQRNSPLGAVASSTVPARSRGDRSPRAR